MCGEFSERFSHLKGYSVKHKISCSALKLNELSIHEPSAGTHITTMQNKVIQNRQIINFHHFKISLKFLKINKI